jgi:hypothetical protein
MRSVRAWLVLGVASAALTCSFTIGCDRANVPAEPDFVFNPGGSRAPIEITGFTPTRGLAGDTLWIEGSGFSANIASNAVRIGGADAEITAATESTLVVLISTMAASGPIRVSDAAGIRYDETETDFEVRLPDGTGPGWSGDPGSPDIAGDLPDTISVPGDQTTIVLSGTVSGNAGDGYWAITDTQGFVRSQGVLLGGGGSFGQTLPIFCGDQYVVAYFNNSAGRGFYVSEVDRLDCVEPGIRIKLSWDIDVTDVDLHFIRPGGVYNRAPGDCFFANVHPDWGVEGDESDDPLLDVDDVDGYGPENIFLDPSENGDYRVAVHYYSDDGQGPSDAWIEVFIDGARVSAFGPHTLPQTGAVWNVCTVRWPEGTVIAN